MGTSSSFNGQNPNTPLLPTWVDQPQNDPKDTDLIDRPDIPTPPVKNRFIVTRKNFSQYVSSGGSDRNFLGNSVRHYVRSALGGSGVAAVRMGAERRVTANLINVLQGFRDDGVRQTLKSFSCEHLVGSPPEEVLATLIDVVCEPGGSIDENIARNAYIDAILAIDEIDLDSLTLDNIDTIVTMFIANTVTIRLFNDIGTKLEEYASSEEQAIAIEREVGAFVHGAVRDHLFESIDDITALGAQALHDSIIKIYKLAYDLIDGESEWL